MSFLGSLRWGRVAGVASLGSLRSLENSLRSTIFVTAGRAGRMSIKNRSRRLVTSGAAVLLGGIDDAVQAVKR